MDSRKDKVRLPLLGASAAPPANPNDDLSPEGRSRRRFMTLFGASAALATGAGCKISRGREVVPYTRKKEEIIPGVADFYASTFQEGEVAYPVLVKTREGRPIHIEGNDEHPRHRGKTSYHAIADLLGLYDPDRLKAPVLDGHPASWHDAIVRLAGALKQAAAAKQGIVLVTPAVISPSRQAVIAHLAAALPGLRHIQWEPASDHNGRKAERELLGEIRQTRYHFDKTDVIVTLEADVLGTFGDSVAAALDYSGRRRPAKAAEGMNRLYAFEGGMSLTGSRADVRIPIRPSALTGLAFGLLRAVHLKSGKPLPEGLTLAALEPFAFERWPELAAKTAQLSRLVDDLCGAGSKAIVIAGPAASAEAHVAVTALCRMLGTEGVTMTSDAAPVAPDLASPEQITKLVSDMASSQVAVAVFWDSNLAYDLPQSSDGYSEQSTWRMAMAKVPLRVRIGHLPDETAADCNLILPAHHWLESWNDFRTDRDVLTLQQPVVAPLYETLQGEDIWLRCLAELGQPAAKSYQDFVKQHWQDNVAPKDSPVPFVRFWNTSLHDGVLVRQSDKTTPAPARTLASQVLTSAAANATKPPARAAFELVLDPDPRLADGRFANNGWLQEMPDPITRVAWENPLALSPADADRLNLKNGDLVTLGKGPAVPVFRQAGQAPGVLRLILGHGRWQGSVAAHIGTRAWIFAPEPGARIVSVASVTATGGRRDVALAQDHDTRDGRDVARLWTLGEYAKEPQHPTEAVELPSLYPKQEYKGPRWGMAIDLSACIGCGACVIGCQSENNVPVVGPEQFRKGRAMHWIRIDRYYENTKAESPDVVHEPMLCQHCDNAPCETVCPVQATNHGPDGINQMAYNRCVGTRYCSNNCPYKVRRFNYLDFTSQTPESMQLAFNPEVSVRPRGVMEKCTFCVQRIRNAEQVAKREDRGLRDGDAVPACAAACTTGAIVFGDINDPKSKASQLSRSNRGFRVLEELNTKPAITYLAALRNPSGRGERP